MLHSQLGAQLPTQPVFQLGAAGVRAGVQGSQQVLSVVDFQ